MAFLPNILCLYVMLIVIVSIWQTGLTEEYYVEALNGTACPENVTCHPLLYYSSLPGLYISDSIFYLLEGTHILSGRSNISIASVSNVTLKGLGTLEEGFHKTVTQSTVFVQCENNEDGGIFFQDSENILIDGITVVNCASDKGSVRIKDSYNVSIRNVAILNGSMLQLANSDCFSMEDSVVANSESHGLTVSCNNGICSSPHMLGRITKCNFTTNKLNGIDLMIGDINSIKNVSLMDIKLTDNGRTGLKIAGKSCLYHLDIEKVRSVGGPQQFAITQDSCESDGTLPYIHISHSVFDKGLGGLLYLNWSMDTAGKVLIESVKMCNRQIGKDPAVILQEVGQPYSGHHVGIVLQNVLIEENSFSVPIVQLGNQAAIFFALSIYNLSLINVTTRNNMGSGLAMFDSYITFKGASFFVGNLAVSGGAISVYGNSYIILEEEAIITFINNSATETGGALFVTRDVYRTKVFYCFLQGSVTGAKPVLFFEGNRALVSGSVLYGGAIDECYLWTTTTVLSTQINFSSIIQLDSESPQQTSAISSDARWVCFCIHSSTNCDLSSISKKSMPGENVSTTVAVVGQLGGLTKGDVQIYSPLLLPAAQTYTLDARCTQITQILNVTLNHSVVELPQEMMLSITIVDKNNVQPSYAPLAVNLTVQECPLGFQFSNNSGICDCAEIFTALDCDHETSLIQRDGQTWIAYQEECLLLDDKCPIDYCIKDLIAINISEPDGQCALNRTGLLCGGCDEGLSLLLGTNGCGECTDSYVSLLLPLAAAGLCLFVFILVLRFSISEGTVGGLILFATTVKLNEPLIFPKGPVPVLSQFISWLNLDLGIETCLYNGMDSCTKASLQFVFPTYLFLLMVVMEMLIHVIVQHCERTPKLRWILCVYNSKSSVETRWMVVYLNYSKTLRVIMPAFHSHQLQCCTTHGNGCTFTSVWYLDANVQFLTRCHVILFTLSLTALVFFIVPITVFSFSIQMTRKFKHLVRRKTRLNFFAVARAIGKPLSKKYRFWVGIHLICHLTFTAVATYVTDPFTKLQVIMWICFFLLTFLFTFRVFKSQLKQCLEMIFIAITIVISVLASVESLLGVIVTLCISMTITIGIVIFHVHQRLKEVANSCPFLKLTKRREHNADKGIGSTVKPLEMDKTMAMQMERRSVTTTVVEIL